jgi:hypothetical protein
MLSYRRGTNLTMAEQWKDIPAHPGYQASNQGRIRSIDRVVLRSDGNLALCRGKILKPWPNDKGYLRVHVGKHRYVHDLILEAWIGPRPAGMHGCHTDDNNINNRPSNLKWDTPTANEQAKVRAGRHRNGCGRTTKREPSGRSRRDYQREYRQLNGDKIREKERARDRKQREGRERKRPGRPRINRHADHDQADPRRCAPTPCAPHSANTQHASRSDEYSTLPRANAQSTHPAAPATAAQP